jgi:DNA-binding protein HU-beta
VAAKKPAKAKKPAAKAAPAKKAVAAKAKKGSVKKAAKVAKPAAKATAKKAATKAAKPVKAAKVAKAAKPVVEGPQKNRPLPPKKPAVTVPKNTGSKQYTQSELYDCIRGYCGFFNRSEAKVFYGQFANMIQAALKSGYKVVLPGLGKIQVRKTKARMGRNPATQQPMMIPARKKVAFTPLKALKDAVL